MNTISYPGDAPRPAPHAAGDVYSALGSFYLLASYGPAGTALINLATGLYWRAPVKINGPSITDDEWARIVGTSAIFTLVTHPITLTRIPT